MPPTPASLFEGMPDLVVLIRRDGVLLGHLGGGAVEALRPRTGSTGQKIESQWPAPVAELLRRLVCQAIANRGMQDATFEHDGRVYEARVSAQGPDRAVCTIRQPPAARSDDAGTGLFEMPVSRAERRRFVRRFRESLSTAALRERPLAVAVLYVDGIFELTHSIDAHVGEQVLGLALVRLTGQTVGVTGKSVPWYAGQLNASVLVVVIESGDRDTVEQLVTHLCEKVCEPLAVGTATFQLSPYAGVAMLGADAGSPKRLLHHAWSAAREARRAGTHPVRFYSDTVRMRSLSRMDIVQELREAVQQGAINLRYWARRELVTGTLVAAVGYMQWQHPLRGEVSPREFLAVAEASGLASALSRSVLRVLRDDYRRLTASLNADVVVSFGPLRHHILEAGFLDDITRAVADGGLPPDRLELRIGERALAACDPAVLGAIAGLGVRIIVDDVGRGSASLDLLARAPLGALQLDAGWVRALPGDPLALKVSRAAIGLARAIGLTSIAGGIDGAAQCDLMTALGCDQGMGTFFGHIERVVERPAPMRERLSRA